MINCKNKICILGFILLLPLVLSAQASSDLMNLEIERRGINATGMLLLGGWAAANIVTGSIGYFSASNSTKYFHQFNAAWNTVNMGIAIFGYLQSTGEILPGITNADIIKEYNFMQNLFLLNAGLDVAYIVAGLYLHERSKTSEDNKNRLKGYANSLFVQGGFLLAFDLVKYFIHKSNAEVHLYPAIEIATNSIQMNSLISL